MIIEFILSFLVLCTTATVCSLSSGGYVVEFLEPVLLPGIVAILVLMISISGYGKSFLKIFTTSKKINETDLSGLKKIETALNYSFKALALICFSSDGFYKFSPVVIWNSFKADFIAV